MKQIKEIKLFDFSFINCDCWECILDYISNYSYRPKKFLKDKRLPFVITPNVDQIVKYDSYKDLKTFFSKSFLILPDGQPIIWSSYLLRRPLKKRLTGSDLFPLIWDRIKKRGDRAYFILSNMHVASVLKKEYPNIRYSIPPMISIDNKSQFVDLALKYKNEILEFQPRYVFLGLGFPKQEILSKTIFEMLIEADISNIPIFLLLGAAFEFYTGYKKRAPMFFQKIGLEWFYRFLQEPSRLFRRYFIEDLKFFLILIRELKKGR